MARIIVEKKILYARSYPDGMLTCILNAKWNFLVALNLCIFIWQKSTSYIRHRGHFRSSIQVNLLKKSSLNLLKSSRRALPTSILLHFLVRPRTPSPFGKKKSSDRIKTAFELKKSKARKISGT